MNVNGQFAALSANLIENDWLPVTSVIPNYCQCERGLKMRTDVKCVSYHVIEKELYNFD